MKTKLLKIATIIIATLAGLFLIAFVTYVILYYPRKVEPFDISGSNQSKNILIATHGSDFKNLLTQTMIDSLKTSDLSIKGINVKDMSDVKEEDWDKILIVNSFIVRLNRHVEHFLKDNNHPEKVLLLVTSGGADWQPESDLQVDAITSASREFFIDDLIALINDWLSHQGNDAWEPGDYAQALYFFPGINTENACNTILSEQEHYKTIHTDLAAIINRAGYQYLRLNNTSAAIQVFNLNIKLFPEDWNVYDSYGEALATAGDKEAAIKNYKKALELNPESVSSQEMLKKLSKN